MNNCDKSLEVSIPMKLLSSSMFDTPPATPFDKQTTPSSSFNSCAPRTPRKPRQAVKTWANNNQSDGSAIISFKMHKTLKNDSMPTAISLDISCYFNNFEQQRRPFKSRRMLVFDDNSKRCNLTKQRRSAMKFKNRLQQHLASSFPPSDPIDSDYQTSYEFTNDADDEMDHFDLLSPPNTPLPKVNHSNEETPLPSSTSSKTLLHSTTSFTKHTKKTCQSCHTTKTPLWRDSEDGTPYCNACGIRYRKYRTRCPSCFCVPHKDDLITSTCGMCGLHYGPRYKATYSSRWLYELFNSESTCIPHSPSSLTVYQAAIIFMLFIVF